MSCFVINFMKPLLITRHLRIHTSTSIKIIIQQDFICIPICIPICHSERMISGIAIYSLPTSFILSTSCLCVLVCSFLVLLISVKMPFCLEVRISMRTLVSVYFGTETWQWRCDGGDSDDVTFMRYTRTTCSPHPPPHLTLPVASLLQSSSRCAWRVNNSTCEYLSTYQIMSTTSIPGTPIYFVFLNSQLNWFSPPRIRFVVYICSVWIVLSSIPSWFNKRIRLFGKIIKWIDFDH